MTERRRNGEDADSAGTWFVSVEDFEWRPPGAGTSLAGDAPAFEVRERTEADDTAALVRLWRRSREDAQPWLEARMGHTPEDDLRHFRDVVAVKNRVWLAVEDGRVLGWMALSGDAVDQLYVDPGEQGRGVGTALLARAKELSPHGLTLFTHQRNTRARAFYERRGFRAVAFGTSPPPESEPDVRYAWTP